MQCDLQGLTANLANLAAFSGVHTSMFSIRRLRQRRHSRGQSLVELALVLPVMLVIMLLALDFGRVYLGYINLQNMARIAANFAADNPDTNWADTTDPVVQDYRNQIINDAKANNCSLPVVAGVAQVPVPVYADGDGNTSTNELGDTATVGISCNFRLITPVISNLIGTNGNVKVSAASVFPIKAGMSGTSGAVAAVPHAEFVGDPTAGTDPLNVQFTDQSTNAPASWSWDFNADGTVDSTDQDPTFPFTLGCHTISLTATNSAGSDTETKINYICVNSPPIVVNFTAMPTGGPKPLTVTFTDASTGSPTAWAWDFNEDGTIDSTQQNPTFVFTTEGTYDVTLTATYPTGPVTRTISNMITVTVGLCIVPNFANTSSTAAQATWNAAFFTTTVNFQQGGLPWTIRSQNQVVGQQIPCNSPITVSKN